MVDTGVAHGRFQIFHNDHLKYLRAARARCRHLVVAITNPDPTLTRFDAADPGRSSPARNPLSYYERYRIINQALQEQGWRCADFSVVPLPINFPDLYRYYVPLAATFFLTIYDDWGERKLQMFESLGLTTEILWRRSLAEKGLTSSAIRRLLVAGEPWEHLTPPGVAEMLQFFNIPRRLQQMAGTAAP
ncbi:MAG: nicotinate-nucleotide adenylyltransferase [Deltaproteobacteria bacterium]|nr:nicotinate-nucleotide adenylyltransferase [Deltaproteobacteria bacterium]